MIGWIIFGIVLVLVIFVIVWFITTYNKLVKARNRVKNSWSQIDVQLNRRFDLIPNLVETTKGYASHEKEILGAFARARDVYSQANASSDIKGMAEANNMLTSTLSKLIAVSEAYPELKADAQFQKMMEELTNTEDKIAYARQFYNDVVMTYNNMREVFPSTVVASLFAFKEAELFKVSEESRQNVKVQF